MLHDYRFQLISAIQIFRKAGKCRSTCLSIEQSAPPRTVKHLLAPKAACAPLNCACDIEHSETGEAAGKNKKACLSVSSAANCES
jgi:hypothetical protein